MQNQDSNSEFKYLSIGQGNNVQLVKYIVLTRPWWQFTESNVEFNLRWQQYAPAPTHYNKFNNENQIYSHLPNYLILHSKIQFYKLLTKNNPEKALSFIMPTYFYSGQEKQHFINHFNYLSTDEVIIPDIEDDSDFELPVQYNFTPKPSKNLWILKPIGLNRGRGIQVISTLEQAEEHLSSQKVTQKITNMQDIATSSSKNTLFLIQKYIENPYLINSKKFDIRCFSLALDNGSAFIHQRGYLRLSGSEFTLNSTDPGVHLTNNAVQQYCENYDTGEGFMLGFSEFEILLQKERKISFLEEIWPKIVEIMTFTMESAALKLVQTGSCRNCFELFGFDFMLDNELKPFVIEVNSNPCLELSSAVSWDVIPKILDDVFRLTIDKSFPPPSEVVEIYKKMQAECDSEGLDLEYWQSTAKADRRLQGLKWQCLYGDKVKVSKNGFTQVVKKFQRIK